MAKKSESYDHKLIEKNWQKRWLSEAVNTPKDMNLASKPFYNLWMFPYPSGEGLHAGHAFASTGSDIYGRFKRMHGFDVFQPIGYDSFGIHSENFAIKIGEHPEKMLARTTQNYANQLQTLGHGYDWTRTVTTSEVYYYQWTQWLFVQLFKAGLAYRKTASVNWCPSCKTVISDEQAVTPAQAGKIPEGFKSFDSVPEGTKVCERCGTIIELKSLEQWFFRITDYADRLLTNLDSIDWSARVSIAQRNWIGKKEGITIFYPVKDAENISLEVWTSRPDTNFGATFIVLAPEHPLARKLADNERKQKVTEYIELVKSKSKDERIAEGREKTGIFTGRYAVNQLNGQELPIWVSDFVLPNVGTGAVVGVPGHDERDYAFARKFGLPIKKVVDFDIETHSIAIKKSLSTDFLEEVKKSGWYTTDYEGWGYAIVIPRGEEDKYIKLVQRHLKVGWYVHTDGNTKAVIFKDKWFDTTKDNEKAKDYARQLGIPEQQIDWDSEENYMFCFEGEGVAVNSEFINKLATPEAKKRIMDFLESNGWGKRENNYHLRDWLISRQRYWGPPIPMIYCETCAQKGQSYFTQKPLDPVLHATQDDWNHKGWYPDENLPVTLPHLDDYQPEGEGRGPLAKEPDFYTTLCPVCGSGATRETDVSDTFLDSSWYFLRYPSVDTESASMMPFDKEITKKWLPVDLYFGGAEHAVLHLMYARFITMVLKDLDFISFEEPFPRFFAHGLMIKDGAKMSKSRGNVVNPDEYLEKFGADSFRLYVMFLGPMDGSPDFRDTGIEGMHKFIRRLWRLLTASHSPLLNEAEVQEIEVAIHKTVKRVTEDIEKFSYNTAISALMEFVNLLREKETKENADETSEKVWIQAKETLTLLLAPFTPHLAEEIWVNYLGKDFTIHKHAWPVFDVDKTIDASVKVVVQVNGKVRGTVLLPLGDASDESIVITAAKNTETIANWLEGKEINKTIFVPGKLINFVI